MDLSVIFVYFTLFISLFFEIFMLLMFMENKNEIKKKREEGILDDNYNPSVSIIVPCWNEEDTIAGTLKSILELNYPKDRLKIIVVDDGSTDNTAKIVKGFLEEPQINLIQKENGGKHTAMNRALEEVDTDIIGSLDADSFVEKDALKYIVWHFKNEKVAAVTSAIKVLDDKNIWARLQKSEFLMAILVRKIFSLNGSIFITPGPFTIMRTKVVKKLKGWKKAHNTEDMEIGVRMQLNNYIIENEERAVVYTKPLRTLKGLYKQRLRWLYGFLKNSWDYKYIFFNKKYGNLGMFVLPYSMVAVVSVVILFALMIFKIIQSVFDLIEKIYVSGWSMGFPGWEWFFIETDAILWIILSIILLTIYLLVNSKKMVKEDKIYGLDILFYISLYGFIAPLWLVAAFWKSIMGIENKWEDN